MPADECDEPQVYPCVVYALSEKSNPQEYKKGARFRVDDIDGDQAYFSDKPRMFEILNIHSLHPITSKEMAQLRKERLRK